MYLPPHFRGWNGEGGDLERPVARLVAERNPAAGTS